MITVSEACALIDQNCKLKKREISLPLESALGKKISSDIFSTYDQPPFNRVSMDGIALKRSILSSQTRYKIMGIQKAGSPQLTLDDDKACLEVMTGAVLPKNTDVVIPYEKIEIEGDYAILPNDLLLRYMDNVHLLGSDYKKNDLMIEKGTVLAPGHLALLASLGYENVSVFENFKIAIVSTGDELVSPGLPKLDHQIYRSNPYALNAALNSLGFSDAKLFHLKDNYEEVLEGLKTIISEHEIIAITGGVSMGKYDFIPRALAELEIKNVFYKVQQRPGKPLWFGVGKSNQMIFGLPGNPVSCLLNLRKYVGPILLEKKCSNPSFFIKANSDFKINKDMTFFVPSSISFLDDGSIAATPLFGNGSGDYFYMKDADGFIEVDNLDNKNNFKKGEIFPFYHWKM